MIIVLALSISAETTVNTAAVYFYYEEPKSITHFKATVEYLDSTYQYKGEGCSVKVTNAPWKCVIQRLYEAVDFNIIARACNKEVCARPVMVRERTKLRGSYYCFF